MSSAPDVAILVVDDNPDHLELVVSALARRCDRARIATARDGIEALDFLLGRRAHAGRDIRKQPRLIVLDLSMPRLDGLQALDAIRNEPQIAAIPVVVLSGSSDKAQLDRCYKAGANSVVRKTADFQELEQKMAKVHDFWLTVNEADRHSRV